MEVESDRPRTVDDLIALVSSAVAIVVLIFSLVLYAHYFHLHTYANHIFVLVALGSSFLVCSNIFWNIFVFPSDEDRFTTNHCKLSGFLHEAFSLTMVMGVIVSWASYAAKVRRWEPLIIRSTCGVVARGLFCTAIGASAASIAIGSGVLHFYRQAWCHGGETWYVATFQVAPIAFTVVPVLMATVPPLRSDRVNGDQKGLLWRRVACHLLWVAVELYSALGTELKGTSFGKAEQAGFEPFGGIVLSLGFLYSERMLTFRALGLPPGADPPHGFTNAMHYIPDKLYYDDTEALLRDTTVHHKIVGA